MEASKRMKLKPILPLLLAALPTTAFAGVSLNGAGATFPNPIYQRWFSDFSQSSGNRVNYQSVGSGAGIRQFVQGTVDFAASDEPIKPSEAAKVKRGVVQIPVTAGTVAIGYNKPGCSLKLTQKQLTEVYLGSIKDWSQLGCSKGAITPVHRSDGSGTTAVFTSSLSSFSKNWKNKVGEGKSVNFPSGIAAKGNEGVSATVKKTPGAIGYMNLAYARGAGVQIAALENKSGKFVLPNVTSGSASVNKIGLNSDSLAGENPNPEGASAYPITTLTWLLFYKSGNGSKTEALRAMVNYALSQKAQMQADDLGYVPLSGSVLNKSRQAVNRISK